MSTSYDKCGQSCVFLGLYVSFPLSQWFLWLWIKTNVMNQIWRKQKTIETALCRKARTLHETVCIRSSLSQRSIIYIHSSDKNIYGTSLLQCIWTAITSLSPSLMSPHMHFMKVFTWPSGYESNPDRRANTLYLMVIPSSSRFPQLHKTNAW